MTTTLVHDYAPRGAALEVFKRRDREVLLSGPAGTGKSRAALEKIHLALLATPKTKALALRKTMVSLAATGLVTYEEYVAAESIAAGHVKFFGGSMREPACYRYTNGSRLVVGGMDNPTKIMSSEYDLIYVQEAIEFTYDEWEKCTTRLRNNRIGFQQLLADTNPDADTHWLNKRCQENLTVMLFSRHEDNPVYFDADGTMTPKGEAYIKGVLDNLTGVRKLRLRDGLWVAAEGVIYEDYRTDIHRIPRVKVDGRGKEVPVIGADWPRYWSIDFGYTNPFVLQMWAEDPDGRLYRYREIYHTKRLVERHALDALLAISEPVPKEELPGGEELPEREVMTARDVLEDVSKGLRRWTEPLPDVVVCDHDAEGRATWEEHTGLKTTPARKTIKVSEGIQAVQERTKVRGDGRPRVFYLFDSLLEVDEELKNKALPTCTEEEKASYAWKDSKKKDEPQKENDHGCDGERYLVVWRDMATSFNIRTLG